MILVGICTCRHPEGLAKALTVLQEQRSRRPFEVLVVDNDDAAEGRAVAEAHGASYVLEREPGIPFARNALLREAQARDTAWLAMIDDDEQPLPGWLDALVEAAERTGADVVGGPVVPRFAIAPRPPVKSGDFEKLRPDRIRGRVAVLSTANLLLSRRLLTEWREPFFDARFRFTGGSDTEFLRRTLARGFRHAFAAEARVVEDIPASRVEPDWLLRRRFRIGNTHARVCCLHAGHAAGVARYFPHACALFLRGSLRRMLAADPSQAFRGARDFARARGLMAGLLGRADGEYSPERYRN
ncbi:hypothetical protein OG2516_05713 [Oceanicola granulosus HTCC2516]|uniref:Glycosyltransferase 2-like domain-containing protein n=1 Tax=Oceanicola granulosus (strain ATCC BAA-861 / DSM 15982 / KCTC 12143 / HTCC2516) TaxID=314256 RepID=Q2CIK9_OCEGH|nr:glycosyltransferase [Oceanicola granulosus]EAR52580.1 hypothetical protein OG2516_05713 [Oceanicola granulosus HTCC2516]